MVSSLRRVARGKSSGHGRASHYLEAPLNGTHTGDGPLTIPRITSMAQRAFS